MSSTKYKVKANDLRKHDKVTGRIICQVKDCDKSATHRFKASHSGTVYGYCDKHFSNT